MEYMRQAREAYRVRAHENACARLQREHAELMRFLPTVERASYERVPVIDMMGQDATPIEPVVLSEAETRELVELLLQGQPVPPPDAEVVTRPGREPLVFNEHFEIVESPELKLKARYEDCPLDFRLDSLYLYDAAGNRQRFHAWGDILHCAEAEKYRNRWGGPAAGRPRLLLPEPAWHRFMSQPSRARFRESVNQGNRPDDYKVAEGV